MSSEPVIRVRGLTKAYPMYARPHHRLLELIFGEHGGRWRREHVALREVDFDVAAGETVGIVGRNGSGKSTLLQLLCGTLTPSGGEAMVRGRVAALLELGAGFNPEFTGRENVFLNGTVLGLTRREIEDRFEDILAFADIGDFIEQPVRTYSSGMYIRLAFAVAISVDPDVLIVDEALSVGDEAFQRKCFARIEQLRERGTTVLFVSHSSQSIVQLCHRAIWLENGEIRADGVPREVVALYHRATLGGAADPAEIAPEAVEIDAADAADAPAISRVALEPCAAAVEFPRNGAFIDDATLVDEQGAHAPYLERGRRYRFAYSLHIESPVGDVRAGMMLRNRTGIEISGALVHPKADQDEAFSGGERMRIVFEFDCLLAPGVYFLSCGAMGVKDGREEFLHRWLDAFELTVIESVRRDRDAVEPHGIVDLRFDAAIRPLES